MLPQSGGGHHLKLRDRRSRAVLMRLRYASTLCLGHSGRSCRKLKARSYRARLFIVRITSLQMGSSMKETIFADEVMEGLKSWKKRARKNLANRRSVPSDTFLPRPCTWLTDEASSSCGRTPRKREFRYPSRRLELLEVQRVVEEVIQHGANNMPSDGEVSFGLWRRPMN